jgi:hypothetical protein
VGHTIDPANLTWVVIGDRDRIADDLETLGVDEVRLIDADGNSQSVETKTGT